MATSATGIRTAGQHRVYELKAAADADVEDVIISHADLVDPAYLGNFECINYPRYFDIGQVDETPWSQKGGFAASGTALVDLDIMIQCVLGPQETDGMEGYGDYKSTWFLVYVNGFYNERWGEKLHHYGIAPQVYHDRASWEADINGGKDTGLTISVVGDPGDHVWAAGQVGDFVAGEIYRLQVAAGETLSGKVFVPPAVQISPIHANASLANWYVKRITSHNVVLGKGGTGAGAAASGSPTARVEILHHSLSK